MCAHTPASWLFNPRPTGGWVFEHLPGHQVRSRDPNSENFSNRVTATAMEIKILNFQNLLGTLPEFGPRTVERRFRCRPGGRYIGLIRLSGRQSCFRAAQAAAMIGSWCNAPLKASLTAHDRKLMESNRVRHVISYFQIAKHRERAAERYRMTFRKKCQL